MTSPLHAEALGLLRASLDDPAASFRPDQWEAIERLVECRHRVLVVQRTGWGKSSVYFIATRLSRLVPLEISRRSGNRGELGAGLSSS